MALLFPVLLILSAASALLGGSDPPRADKGPPTQSSTGQGVTTASKEITKQKTSPPSKGQTVPKKQDRSPGNKKTEAGKEATTQKVPTPGTSDRGETGAKKAAGDYYRAVGRGDWDYTYDHLDSTTKKSNRVQSQAPGGPDQRGEAATSPSRRVVLCPRGSGSSAPRPRWRAASSCRP